MGNTGGEGTSQWNQEETTRKEFKARSLTESYKLESWDNWGIMNMGWISDAVTELSIS